jgi:ferredoxin
MPLNVFYVEDEKTNQNKIEKGLEEAHQYTLMILNGESEWGRVPILSDAVNTLSRGALKITDADFHQKLFIFDPEPGKCKKCGICVDLCPVGNIQMVEGEYPKHGLKCEYCLRCVSFCPRQAMPAKFNYKGKTYHAVKAKEFLR